ncbi:unnamed protein product [Symbiodinium sp. CCMP2456]|nr:unnamed protein product [Symbiodinium sp. CCMP2456]
MELSSNERDGSSMALAMMSSQRGWSRWPRPGTLLTSSYDGTTKFWSISTGRCWRSLKQEGPVMSVAVSSDGRYLLTAAYDGVAAVWCVARGEAIRTLKGQEGGLYTAVFSPNGQSVLTASAHGAACMWRWRIGKVQWLLKGHEDNYMRSATFSPDGETIVTTSSDCSLRIWQLDSSDESRAPVLLRTLEGHYGWVNTAVFSPGGDQILSAAADKTARLWSASTGACLRTFTGHWAYVRSAVFSPQQTMVLTASADWTAKLWNSQSATCIQTFTGHSQWVNMASFVNGLAKIVTCSRDNSARLWDTKTGACLRVYDEHSDFVMWAMVPAALAIKDHKDQRRKIKAGQRRWIAKAASIDWQKDGSVWAGRSWCVHAAFFTALAQKCAGGGRGRSPGDGSRSPGTWLEAAPTCQSRCERQRTLLAGLVALAAKSGGEGLDLELAVPEDSDMQELTDLVDESFQRAIQARMVDGGNPLGDLWNGWVSLSERQMTLGAMRKRLAGLLSSPSLRRPSNDEWNLGVLLREKGVEKPPIGYFEICMQKPEGISRRSAALEPYLKNLCVSKAYRRRGLGKKLLNLVEAFCRTAWQGSAIYLHTDDDAAAFNLYNSTGYTVRKQEKDGEGVSFYMFKRLE